MLDVVRGVWRGLRRSERSTDARGKRYKIKMRHERRHARGEEFNGRRMMREDNDARMYA
jgi:hypothetical protein